MKDLRMEVRIARMKKGVKYTALLNIDSLPANDPLSALDGTRVPIKKVTKCISGYDYMVGIGEDTLPVFPQELSEWKEE